MPEKTGRKQVKRRPNGTFKKGVSGNPSGRPKGTKNFSTKWRQAVEKIAEANEVEEEDIEMVLLKRAYKEAKNGNYRFYKDIMDRIYGKAVQPADITSKAESLNVSLVQYGEQKVDLTTDQKKKLAKEILNKDN